MKKLTAAVIFLSVSLLSASAMAKGFGSYPAFKAPQSNSYSMPKYANPYSAAPRNYSHGGELRLQQGYFKGNGTYVMPHLKTMPDNYKWNNLGNWK